MIPRLQNIAATRQRFGGRRMVQGRPQRPTPVESPISISWQPAPKKTVDRLSDGKTSRNVITGLSYDTSLRVAGDGVYADRLVINGTPYELLELTHSPAFLGQPAHVMFSAIEVQPLVMPEAP